MVSLEESQICQNYKFPVNNGLDWNTHRLVANPKSILAIDQMRIPTLRPIASMMITVKELPIEIRYICNVFLPVAQRAPPTIAKGWNVGIL